MTVVSTMTKGMAVPMIAEVVTVVSMVAEMQVDGRIAMADARTMSMSLTP
jgi:hypothetical protein